MIFSWIKKILHANDDINEEIYSINLNRIKIAAPILFIVHIIHAILFSIDLHSYSGIKYLWRKGIVDAHIHASILIFSVGILTFTLLRDRRSISSSLAVGIQSALVLGYLYIGAQICAVDQYVTTSINPFLLVTLGIGIMFTTRPIYLFIFFIIGYVIFYQLTSLIQKDAEKLLSVHVNGLSTIGLNFIISIFFWFNTTTRLRQDRVIASQQQALQEKNLQLVEMAREKDEFLAMATHDLKNPLAAIQILTDLILESDSLSKEVSTHLLSIHNSSRRMHNLISKLLEVNQIDLEHILPRNEKFELVSLCKELISNTLPLAHNKQQTLAFHSNSDFYILNLDRIYLYEIIDNLISNAIKFSPYSATISLTISRKNDEILIEIADQGPGLSEEDIKHLFKRFTRLKPKPTGGEYSSGLGLFISKYLTDIMGGSIECKSSIGKGSKFILHFPLVQSIQKIASESEPTLEEWKHFINSLKILIVEDDNLMSRILLQILKRQGLEADTASTGEEAISLLSKNEYNLVFTDQNMPDMNGLSLIQKFQNPNHSKINFVLNSADKVELNIQLSNPIFAFLIKPITEVKLRTILLSLFHKMT
jgi:signal transduction histidine kinase